MTRPTQGDHPAASPAGQRGGATSTRSRPVTPDQPAGPRRDDERAGARRAQGRTSRAEVAEPLAASWDPDPESDPGPGATRANRRRRRFARAASTYGWRVYAVPVLIVLTVLAVLDSARSPAPQTPEASAGSPSDEAPAVPLIPHPGAGPGFGAAKAAAELPGGGPFTKRGAGTWSVVPGAGPKFGTGKLSTYTVEVEDGVEMPGGPRGFATTVDATLNNPKSWMGSGRYAFRRVDDPAAADIRISLTSQLTTREVCGFGIPYDASCWKGNLKRVVINHARWARGAVAFQGNIVQYQQYVINHEVGHALGFQHVPCEATGELAPIMMQQTWGVSNDYIAALGSDGVEANGQVCEPNAWPFPAVD
ncbi:MAG: DUF3152 domain-containing protein [Pseudonocardiaceae bacterium]|nr:DUF3152 domain-containing protein [Pseudonocardiaceae bacterium]